MLVEFFWEFHVGMKLPHNCATVSLSCSLSAVPPASAVRVRGSVKGGARVPGTCGCHALVRCLHIVYFIFYAVHADATVSSRPASF